MIQKITKLTVITVMMCSISSFAECRADEIPGLFTTGVDNAGVVLPLGSLDPHYVVIETGNMSAVAMTYIPGVYIPNDANSLWIWENADGSPTYVTRTFRTTFDLTGFDPNTASISGTWATDNVGLDILINGQSTGNTSPHFLSYSNFAINDGFTAGVNTLDFIVRDDGSISAFRVGSISGTAAVSDLSEVVGSFVFHTGFSGSGTPPWNAIDSSKTLAKEGSGPQTLHLTNVINTLDGINGLVFDIQNLANSVALSPSDFTFQVSPTGAFDPGGHLPVHWQTAVTPSITVTPGSPDRVLIQWPDQTILNRYLRVTILGNQNTGLPADEVYYVGHLLGETTGAAEGNFTVAFADISPIRAEVGQSVDASSVMDIDKNGTVSFADISAMRSNVGAQLPAITIP